MTPSIQTSTPTVFVPMSQLSPELRSYLENLVIAARNVRLAGLQVRVDLHKEGFRFPSAIDYVYEDLLDDIDRLASLLNPSLLTHAEGDARRETSQSEPGTQAPA